MDKNRQQASVYHQKILGVVKRGVGVVVKRTFRPAPPITLAAIVEM